MVEIIDIELVSGLHSRLFAWIKTNGHIYSGGWTRCKATNRALGFLDSLSIEYTIEKSNVWFTFLNESQESIDFWQIQGLPFIEEFYFIRNFAVLQSSLNLTLGEEIPFLMLIEGLGYKYTGPLNHITKIEKK